MKNLKLLFICICLFFMTGCTATYNLTITENDFNEKITINMNQSEYNDFLKENNNRYVNMYYDDPNNIGYDGVEHPIKGVKYYDFSNNDSSKSVTFTGKFDEKEFDRSKALVSGFNSVKVRGTNEEIHIKSSTGFTFLYEELTNVKIKITSPFEVAYSNADSINGNTLTWNITKSNAEKKTIEVGYNKNKDEDIAVNEGEDTNDDDSYIDNEKIDNDTDENNNGNETNSNIFLIVIAFVIIIIAVITSTILIKKKNKLNQI